MLVSSVNLDEILFISYARMVVSTINDQLTEITTDLFKTVMATKEVKEAFGLDVVQ